MPHHYLAAQTSESCTVGFGNIRRDIFLRTCVYTKIVIIIIFFNFRFQFTHLVVHDWRVVALSK